MAEEGTDLATLLKGAATSGDTDDASAQGDKTGTGEDEGEKWRSENTRLRQGIAQLQELNQRALPMVRFVSKLAESDKGKAILEKFQAGEDFGGLLGAEKKVVTEAAKETTGVTLDEVKTLLAGNSEETVKKVTESVAMQQQARENIQRLNAWAEKEFPGYDKLRGKPEWNGYVDAIFAAMNNGTLVPPKGDEPWQFAIKKAYQMATLEHPDIVKGTKKAAAPKAEDRLAEILASGRKPSSSSAKDIKDELPDKYKRQLEFIRGLGSGGVGKSFSNPPAKAKKD